MPDQSQRTLGEVVRILESMQADLAEIKVQTTKTNGIVIRHDQQIETNTGEIKTLRANMARAVWTVIGVIGGVVTGVVTWFVKGGN